MDLVSNDGEAAEMDIASNEVKWLKPKVDQCAVCEKTFGSHINRNDEGSKHQSAITATFFFREQLRWTSPVVLRG